MPIKICIVALHAYPVVDSNAPGVFGGTETRAWTIAQGLAKIPGVEVSFVVRNSRLKTTREIDYIRVIPYHNFVQSIRFKVAECVKIYHKFPFLILIKWNWMLPFWLTFLVITKPFRPAERDPTTPESFFTNIDAEVICAFGVHSTSATVISSAKVSNKKSLLFLGADSDLDTRYQPDSSYRTPYNERADVCYYALTHSDAVVAQKPEQVDLLKERFHRESLLFPNPIDLDSWKRSAGENQAKWQEFKRRSEAKVCPDQYVLWIGRADNFHKRADFMLKIAQACEKIPFLMIMNPRDSSVESHIRKSKPPNLFILDKVPFDLMSAVFSKAMLFVNTSSHAYEGFPNTFLQATALNVPILSLETAGDFLSTNQSGTCYSGNLDQLILDLKSQWENKGTQINPGNNQRDTLEAHNLGDGSHKLLEYINQLLSSRG